MSNIYLGLQSYKESDTHNFKGRQEDAQTLFEQVIHNEYTVCYAKSGEGKTSLINAGLFPLLRRSLYFPISISFNQKDFENDNIVFNDVVLKRIDEAIEKYKEETGKKDVVYDISSSSTDFAEFGLDRKQSLQKKLEKKSWWKLRNYKPQIAGIDLIPVFVFDQFEEVFDRPKSILWTKKFFAWLETVSTDLCPNDIVSMIREEIGADAPFPKIKKSKDFKAIFSLRNEFIGDMDYWCMQKFFIPDLKNNRFCLKPLTITGAKEIMKQGEFDTQTVFDVIKYLAGNEYSDTVQDVPCISALLLSIVCTSLSEKNDIIKQSIEVQSNPNNLVNHIITLFYQQSIENLKKERNGGNGEKYDEEVRIPKKHLRTIERALIDDNGKRLRISVTSNELKKIDFIENYLGPLENGRLIRISHFEGQDYVELIHDQLAEVVFNRVKKRTSQRVTSLGASALFVFLLIMACVTLRIMVKSSNLAKHDLPTLYLDREGINHSSSNSTPSKEKCVEELHLKLAKHSIISLKQLKRLYIEDNNSHQAQITVQDCPLLDEIYVDDPITELILNINDSVTSFNAIVYIDPSLKKITINNIQNILTFVVPKENKNFIWKDNTLWNSKGEIVYVSSKNKGEIEFPDAFNDQMFVLYEGNKYINKNFLICKDNYRFTSTEITSEEVAQHPAKRIIITNRVKSIKEEAFKYQDSLSVVIFDPDCELSIGNRAFAYCKNLKNVKLPMKMGAKRYKWWENPFLECHNVKFELPELDSSNLQIDVDGNGVVWRLGVIRGRDTINEPVFFSNGTKNTEVIPMELFIPIEIEKRTVQFHVFNNGVADIHNCKVLLRTDLPELDITDYISSACNSFVPFFDFYNTKNIEKIHICRSLPDFKLKFADSDKSDITLVVPKGCKTYYENDDDFKGFRRIEEENRFWLPYCYSMRQNWMNTRYYVGEYWKLMLPILLVVIILYSVLIDFVIRFNNRSKGKERLAISSRVLLILSYILLGFFSYTVFYWLFLTSFSWGSNAIIWCNVIAVMMAIIISLSMLYLSNVAGDWALFKSEWKSFLKKTKGKIAELPIFIRKWWKLFACIILAIISIYGICQRIKTIKNHRDLDKMIEAKDWKRVSQLVYNKIMDADSIDDIDWSWTRTMLLAANQDTISNGYQCKGYSYVSSSSYMVYKDGSKTYVIDIKSSDQKPVEIEGISSNFDGVFNDRYLLTYSPCLCYYDLASHRILFDKKINGGYDVRYFNSGIKSWCDNGSYWRKNHDSKTSTVFIFNGNALTLDSIPFPKGYEYMGNWSMGRYLRFYTSGESPFKAIYYDIVSKEFTPEPNNMVLFNPHYICKQNNDTLIISTNQSVEIENDTITDAMNYNGIIVFPDCLIYRDTIDNLQYISLKSKTKTTLGKGKTLFYYGYESFNDTILYISQFDTIKAYQINTGTPIKLVEKVVKNRIQYYGEGGKNLYNCMKKGIIANNTNDTVRICHLLYGKELKTFNTSFDFNSINENFIIKYDEKTKYIELYPLDGSSIKAPIIIKTQNALNSKYEVSTVDDCIVKTNRELFVLPSLEQTINNNVYLNESQKAKLIDKFKSKSK